MDECHRCKMRDDDWFLCRDKDCPQTSKSRSGMIPMIHSPEAIEAVARAIATTRGFDPDDIQDYREGRLWQAFVPDAKAALAAAVPYHFEEAAKVAEDAAKAERHLRDACKLPGDRLDRLVHDYAADALVQVRAAIRALARPET